MQGPSIRARVAIHLEGNVLELIPVLAYISTLCSANLFCILGVEMFATVRIVVSIHRQRTGLGHITHYVFK